MVKKSTLEKLSNRELEKYLQPQNRFVPEAVQIAFNILQDRGRIFSDAEINNIQHLIQHKKESEAAKKYEEIEDWKDHITTDPSAVKLYSRTFILISGVFLGTLFGAILLSLNFLKLKKYIPAVFTFLLGIIYVPLQFYAYKFIVENNLASSSRYSPEILPVVTGPLILVIIWVTSMPKRIVYRSQSYLFPSIFAAIMLFLIFSNYERLFSSYFLMRFSE